MASEEDQLDIEAMATFLPQTNEKLSETNESQVIVIENNNEQQVYFAESQDGFKDSGKSKKASRYVQNFC